jgi:hypothetical protein
MKLSKIVMTSAIIFILSSCTLTESSVDPSSIPTPDIYIETQIGKYLGVSAPKGWNSFKTNEQIALDIQNISEKPITSDADFDARIFLLSNDEWIEVKNKAVYEDDQITLVADRDNIVENFAATIVTPDLANYEVTSHIRVYVFGNLVENEKETKRVASFIDIQLNP